MTDTLELALLLPASPRAVYDAYLDSRLHTAMTGSPATIEPREGAAFSAWDGYIRGRNVKLIDGETIVQTWRASDFPEGAEDSTLTLTLSEQDGETKLQLVHANLPQGTGERFTEGWKDFYFIPMEDFFAKGGAASLAKRPAAKKPAAKKPAAKKPAAKKPAAKKPAAKQPAAKQPAAKKPAAKRR
jgi:activator of HSP90 ATPase